MSEELYIEQVTRPLREYVNNNSDLLSVLYDIDLLPEQIQSVANAKRLSYIVYLHKIRKDKEADNVQVKDCSSSSPPTSSRD